MSDERIEDNFVEILLKDDGSFLKIKETLTRIGIGSVTKKVLTQTCSILHKKDRFYIVHFKEMFLLDGKDADITDDDIKRRNAIIFLLSEWDLLDVVDDRLIENRFKNSKEGDFRVVGYHDFNNSWTSVSKYTIGGRNE